MLSVLVDPSVPISHSEILTYPKLYRVASHVCLETLLLREGSLRKTNFVSKERALERATVVAIGLVRRPDAQRKATFE
jgi:hypothetical protein